MLAFCMVLLMTSHTCVTSLHMTLLHTNDVHAHVQQSNKYGSACTEQAANASECYGGAARMYTQIETERNREPNILLLDAGDQFQTLGNHDFDSAIEGLDDFLTEVGDSFPVVCCNVDFSAYPDLAAKVNGSVELTLGTEKIGIVGWITKETEFLAAKDKIKGLVFLDEIESIEKEISILKGRGINKIIGLSHTGLRADYYIAENVDDLDIIIGGHNNAFLYNGVAPDIETVDGPYPVKKMSPSGEPVLVVQAFMQSKYLGVLDVTFDEAGVLTEWGGNPVLLNGSIPQDPVVLAEVNKWAIPLQNYTKTKLGETYVDLDSSKATCRLAECSMGNAVTNAILSNYLSRPDDDSSSWSDVAIAIWNSGGLRASITTGDISLSDVLGVLPFGNQIWLVSMKGKQIRDILEFAAQGYSTVDRKGKFLQFSGLKVVYNLNRPDYKRVHSVHVKCTECTIPTYIEMEDDEVYKFLISQYLLEGGDGFNMTIREDAFYIGDLASDALIDYISRFSPITDGLEGRISFLKETTCTAHASIVTPSVAMWMCYLITYFITMTRV